jgi:hypothetical protein
MNDDNEVLCEEARGVVHWFGVINGGFPEVVHIGGFDMGETVESFNKAWKEHLDDAFDVYHMILREDQIQSFAVDILDALDALTKQRVLGEVE